MTEFFDKELQLKQFEESYLVFFYCFYSGKLNKCQYLTGSNEGKPLLEQATERFHMDPLFRSAWDLNKYFMKEWLRLEDEVNKRRKKINNKKCNNRICKYYNCR